MGYLDALTANTFRTDAEGRLVFVPFRRRRGYLVTPERAATFDRVQRRFWVIMFLVLPASVVAFRTAWAMVLVCLIGIGAYMAGLWHFTRGLESAPQVPAITRSEAAMRVGRAMGSRMTGGLAIAATLLAGGGGWLLIVGLRTWAAWGLTAYFLLLAILYSRQWLRLRHAARAT